jgi:hypothetical protein
VYIIYVNTHTTDRDIIMNEQKRTNKIDDLKKEINFLKERVKKIEESFNAKEIEEKPSAMFM